jgi:peptidoglycan/LPS O-acetylase OafA/YrhL
MRILYRGLLAIGLFFLLAAGFMALGADKADSMARQTVLALAGVGMAIAALAAAQGERKE